MSDGKNFMERIFHNDKRVGPNKRDVRNSESSISRVKMIFSVMHNLTKNPTSWGILT